MASSTATTTESARQAINLRTLQRCDPTIRSILDSASYVVLYKYLGGKWAREGIEGSLFIYERTASPHNGILVLNRNGMNNFVRQLTVGTDLDIQGQIVHVSGGDEKHDGIYGLWFAGGEPEAQRMIDVMNRFVQNDVSSSGPSTGATAPPTSVPTAANPNPLPSQPTMMDLLARLSTTAPATPPPQPRTPVQAPASTSKVKMNGVISESRSTPGASTSQANFGSSNPTLDPSSSLKQLLGVMSPSGSTKTPSRTGTPPVRAPDSPLAVRATIKKADSGYIPSAERNVDVASEGFEKEAARKAVLTAIENGQRAGTGPLDLGSGEDDKQGQRDFVRGLLDCIHTDKGFVEALYKDYLRRKGGGQ